MSTFDDQLDAAIAIVDPIDRLVGLEAVKTWQAEPAQRARLEARRAEAWSSTARLFTGLTETQVTALWAFAEYFEGALTARVMLLSALTDDATFNRVLARVERGLRGRSDQFVPSWLQLLVQLTTTAERRAQALRLLHGGFGEVVAWCRREGELINATAFVHLGRALAALADPTSAVVVQDAFSLASGNHAHYELNQAAGDLALVLCQLAARRARPDLQHFLARFEANHGQALFVAKVRYAWWVLKRDATEALKTLETSQHETTVAWAATALADLAHHVAADAVQARLSTITDPVVREVLLEAHQRLKKAVVPADAAARMVCLFGGTTSSERLLGAESDDTFVRRAKARAEVPEATENDTDAP